VVNDKNFKYPQVLKASIAVDHELPFGLILTSEFMYSKDLYAVNFENVNLPTTGTALTGSDNRTRISSSRIYGSIPAA